MERIRRQIQDALNAAHEEAQPKGEKWELQEVTTFEETTVPLVCPRTAVDEGLIARVVEGMTTFPDTFTLHPKLKGSSRSAKRS